MRAILLAISILFSFSVFAQRTCATQQYSHFLQQDRATAQRLAAAQKTLQNNLTLQKAFKTTDATTAVIRIPVVVHILYNNFAQNITDEQVASQIEALNRDFRMANADAVNIPARFKDVAADVQIEFELASVNPSGKPTTGIVRKATSVAEWAMDDKIKMSKYGGDDAWDAGSYLNIWVGNLSKILGYSSPIGSAANKDGIVITTSAFGTLYKSGQYNMGRTAVHEVGHWLGLKHIWGDEACGDDLVSDTPRQSGFTSGCPGGFKSSCDNGDLGDMYMNYMDFTNDACLLMFTEGQKKRMRANFEVGGARYSLLKSKGLAKATPQAVATAPASKGGEHITAPVVKTFPNPVNNVVTLSFGNSNFLGKELQLVNLNGAVLQKVIVTQLNQPINIGNLKSGIYFIKGQSERGNFVHKIVKL